MEKNEILEKSRRENHLQDEREKTIRIQGESFSLIFVFGIGLLLTTYKLINHIPVGGYSGHVLGLFLWVLPLQGGQPQAALLGWDGSFLFGHDRV